ncbi:hypothetical protein [Haliangium sp.]|uniref:hypothetical protein n=1 Tax=Haliangium sp. TaxID=2663208 RepID=UPI003D0F55E4
MSFDRARAPLAGSVLFGLGVVIGLGGSACRDQPEVGTPPPADAAPAPAPIDAAPSGPVSPPALPLPAGRDEDQALHELGAWPAWEAVVNRSQALGRRDQEGVVHGRLGAPVEAAGGRYRWLIDETEGEGALAIRLHIDDQRWTVEAGQRLAAWGAWWVDDDRRWYWRASRLALLAPAPEAAPVPLPPGLDLPTVAAAPDGAVPISQLELYGDILFEVARSPTDPTDGWDIRDPGSSGVAARLLLPGEHRAYGGQEYRTDDEHWRLVPNTLYTARAKRFRNTRAGDLPLLRAHTVPRRVAP